MPNGDPERSALLLHPDFGIEAALFSSLAVRCPCPADVPPSPAGPC
jgi:hypothetical protein